MKRTLILGAMLGCLGAAQAQGQEDITIDQNGIYVSDPAACAALAKGGDDAFEALEYVILTFSTGLQAMEFQCTFYDVKSSPGTPLLFVDTVCEMPGEFYPDSLAIGPHDATSIRVVSNADTVLGFLGGGNAEGDYPAGTTIYHLCENLSELPF